MALYEFEGTRPEIGKTSFAPESTDIIGDVVIGGGAILDGKMAVGAPAKVIGDMTEKHRQERRKPDGCIHDHHRIRF